VGLRAVRNEQSYLFRVRASPEAARELFLIYLERINELADNPEWYHLLSNNCTLNIVRYMNRVGREGRFRPSHLLNGLFDSYLYSRGYLDTSLSLEQLRIRSRISEVARNVAGASNFSELIRQNLPAFSQGSAATTAESPASGATSE
jgi:hypothetical protein